MADSNIKKLLRALMGPFQDLEDMWMGMLTGRRINNATGVNLDLLGKIVGQPRNGNSDIDYRRFIRARVAANNSDGLVEDFITVTKLVLNDETVYVHVRKIGTATVVITLENQVIDIPLAEIVVYFAKLTVDAGIRVVVEHWMSAEADMFSYAPFPGETGTGKGYGSTLDASVGGVYASSLE